MSDLVCPLCVLRPNSVTTVCLVFKLARAVCHTVAQLASRKWQRRPLDTTYSGAAVVNAPLNLCTSVTTTANRCAPMMPFRITETRWHIGTLLHSGCLFFFLFFFLLFAFFYVFLYSCSLFIYFICFLYQCCSNIPVWGNLWVILVIQSWQYG